jgi:hypothetical protein
MWFNPQQVLMSSDLHVIEIGHANKSLTNINSHKSQPQ